MLKRSEELACFVERKIQCLRVHSLIHGVCTCGDPDCRNAGKHPNELRGIYSSRIVSTWDYFDNWNVGVQCGRGLVVLDVDPRNGGLDTISSLEKIRGPLPRTWVCETGGGGFHYYFQTRERLRKTTLGLGLDFQAEGSYVLAPTSLHKSGRMYEWASFGHPADVELAELPQWIFDLARIPEVAKVDHQSRDPIADGEYFERLEQLKSISSDCSYHEWIRVGMALHATGRREAFAAWDSWSSTSKKYPGSATLAHHWRSFKAGGGVTDKTLAHMAADAVDLSDFKVELTATVAADSPLLASHGIVREIAEIILANSPQEYPDFAYAAALSICSSCVQGLANGPTGRPLSLYQLCLMHAAGGKDHYLRSVVRAILAIDKRLYCGNPGSTYGLRNELYCWNTKLWAVDEAQDWFSSKAKTDNTYVAQMLTDMKEISNGPECLPRTFLKKEVMPEILHPRLSFFGFGTPEKMRSSYTADSVGGGLLSRFMLWNIEEPKATRDFTPWEFPHELIAYLAKIVASNLSVGIDDKTFATNCDKILKPGQLPEHYPAIVPQRRVEWTEPARIAYKAMAAEMESRYLEDYQGFGSVWRRAPERALTLAAIHAAAEGRWEVSGADWHAGEVAARYVAERFYAELETHATEDPLVVLGNKISRALIHGQKSRRQLARGLRISSSSLDKALLDLWNKQEITVEPPPSGSTFARNSVCKRM